MKTPTIRCGLSVLLGMVVALGACSCSKSEEGGESITLSGAGSSFAAPILYAWFSGFHDKNPDVAVKYEGVGSGGGTTQFIAGTVDFAASDAAMSDDEVAQVKGGVVQLPVTAGAEALLYNLPGIADLKLSREAYAGIFLGKIKKWNDPVITSANPGMTLPDSDIGVVHRADSSGTTYVFTLHLSAISPEWKAGPGTGKTVTWPVGIGGNQNEGVTALIKQTPSSIGYVEYGYAINSRLPIAVLQNKAGRYVKCTPETAAAGLAKVELHADLRGWAPDPDGDDSYPIITYTWLLCHTKYDNADKGKALKDVIAFTLTPDGQNSSKQLDYIPLSDAVVQKVKAAADSIKIGS